VANVVRVIKLESRNNFVFISTRPMYLSLFTISVLAYLNPEELQSEINSLPHKITAIFSLPCLPSSVFFELSIVTNVVRIHVTAHCSPETQYISIYSRSNRSMILRFILILTIG
jgi:hypothetical protein